MTNKKIDETLKDLGVSEIGKATTYDAPPGGPTPPDPPPPPPSDPKPVE